MNIRILKDSEKYYSEKSCFMLISAAFPSFIQPWNPHLAFSSPSLAGAHISTNKCSKDRKLKDVGIREDLVWHRESNGR